MSGRYTANGKRRSSMTHAHRAHTCSCGKTVYGNGGKSSHRRSCGEHWLTTSEAYGIRANESPPVPKDGGEDSLHRTRKATP